MWSITLVAKLMRFCGFASIDDANPSNLARQSSVGSQLAAHRVNTAVERRDLFRNSLMGACLAVVCSDGQKLAESLPSLPPDLQQAVLDALILGGQLTDDTVQLFHGIPIYDARLGGYPGVVNGWMECFKRAQLIEVDLSGCSAVRGR